MSGAPPGRAARVCSQRLPLSTTRSRQRASLTTMTASASDRTAATGILVTSMAAGRPSMGVINNPTPTAVADSATDSMPRVGRTTPSKDTSPTAPTSRTHSTGM